MRSLGLMVLAIFFVSNVSKGLTEESEMVLSKQWLWPENEPSSRIVSTEIYPKTQKPELLRTGKRISEKKCVEYIKERFVQAQAQRVLEATQPSNAKGEDDSHNLEVGGREALPAEFPHMGALGWRTVNGSWVFKCGSSLISPKFTVTAAHCSTVRKDRVIENRQPEIVRLGEKNIIDVYANGVNPIDAKILRIIVHPQYSSPKRYYDMALVEFESEIQFSRKVQPGCLWNSFDTSRLGSEASSTGWGVVNTVTKMTSPTLQVTVLDVIDSEQCNKLLRKACNRLWCGLQEHQLCAGKLTGGVDACQGDSGGPLQVNLGLPSDTGSMHYLIGVTSFGIGCGRSNQPGVYTRISSFVDWIESIVWPGE